MKIKNLDKKLYMTCLVLTVVTFVSYFTLSGLNVFENEPYFLCELGGKLIFCDIILTVALAIDKKRKDKISTCA